MNVDTSGLPSLTPSKVLMKNKIREKQKSGNAHFFFGDLVLCSRVSEVSEGVLARPPRHQNTFYGPGPVPSRGSDRRHHVGVLIVMHWNVLLNYEKMNLVSDTLRLWLILTSWRGYLLEPEASMLAHKMAFLSESFLLFCFQVCFVLFQSFPPRVKPR